MHRDFRPLVHPATPAKEIDVDGTKEQPARVNAALRRYQQLARNYQDNFPELSVPETETP